jgi:hypothetical protein
MRVLLDEGGSFPAIDIRFRFGSRVSSPHYDPQPNLDLSYV